MPKEIILYIGIFLLGAGVGCSILAYLNLVYATKELKYILRVKKDRR